MLMTLAARLKQEMAAKGMNQDDLARAIKTSQASISKILDGKTLNPTFILEIAQALGADPYILKFGKPPNGLYEVREQTTDSISAQSLRILSDITNMIRAGMLSDDDMDFLLVSAQYIARLPPTDNKVKKPK